MALRASPAFALHSVARPLWIPACAGMTVVSGNDGGWRVSGRTTTPGIPCVLVSVFWAPRPLRCAKGTGPPSLTTDSQSDHVRLPVARPLWIPAFAGMTVVVHSTRRGGRDLDAF